MHENNNLAKKLIDLYTAGKNLYVLDSHNKPIPLESFSIYCSNGSVDDIIVDHDEVEYVRKLKEVFAIEKTLLANITE